MEIKRSLSNYGTMNKKIFNRTGRKSLIKTKFHRDLHSTTTKLHSGDTNIQQRKPKDNWYKVLTPITKQKLILMNNPLLSKCNNVNNLVNKNQRKKIKSLNDHFMKCKSFEENKKLVNNKNEDVECLITSVKSSTDDSNNESNQNCTGKKVRSDTEDEKTKSKCCCIKGVSEEFENCPEFGLEENLKNFKNLNLFISRLEGIINNSIKSTKTMYELYSKNEKLDSELLKLLSTHLRDQEIELAALYELQANPTTIFDFCLENDEVSIKGVGDIAKDLNDFNEIPTTYNFQMTTLSSVVQEGIVKCSGKGIFYLNQNFSENESSESRKISVI